MQAIFRFRGAEEIVVSNYPGGAMLEILTGVSDQGDGLRHVDHNETVQFSKSQARAVASALMGAAAEL